jgi:hypothetical protein
MNKPVMKIFKGQPLHWQGEGIYIFDEISGKYCKIDNLFNLEFAMKGPFGKTPYFVEENDTVA